ncbi:response regulator transcription factor [Methylotenera sp.]|uniref:response regulator transcription factor n=1 Tax=Methylotenera sp. TaxID=2051956 RepID=UPI002730B31F|nr:response regulator transcription factor [Methylotenera sp.]MDP2070402.1 response regulator transcription factor [Methylotenera sp.]MDP3006574.1 response regulator transcription factor [Methylotenera sp.]
MQDIFISTLPALLDNWTEAFPKSTIAAAVPEVVNVAKSKGKNGEAIIFWLHMNEDRQQWMANTIASIANNYENAKIVILANMPNQAESIHALRLGAMGYCHAYIAPAVLKEIKAVITHGGLWLGQDILQSLIEVSTKLIGNQPEYVDGLLAKLTSREKEVAIEAAKGLSNKEIARILSITERTVKAHLAKTFERLGAKDRLQLALMLNSNYKH